MARFRLILFVASSTLVVGCQAAATAPAPSVSLDEMTYADGALLPEAGANAATVLPAALLLGELDAALNAISRVDEVRAPQPAPKTC